VYIPKDRYQQEENERKVVFNLAWNFKAICIWYIFLTLEMTYSF
jgi:hypothetical protein